MISDSFFNFNFPKIKSILPSFTPRRPTQGDTSQSSKKEAENSEAVSQPSISLATGNTETKREHGAGHTSSLGDSPPTTQPRIINVVLFGETGVGKSSVINLIAQREVAQVSPDVDGCTMQSTRYEIPFDGINFAIFDTIGLEEPQMGVNGYLRAIEKAYELIIRLGSAGGVHLLLFCMRGSRITATTQSNYRLFCECLCSTKVPVALVFTGLEGEVEMEDWWTRNKKHIERYGIKSDGHACVTAVKDDTVEEDEKYLESQTRIRELLKSCALQKDSFSLEPFSWLVRFGRGAKSFVEKARNPNKQDVAKRLRDRCNMDSETARKIADMIEKDDAPPNPLGPPQSQAVVVSQNQVDVLRRTSLSSTRDLPLTSQPRTINVILFGEIGVGQSSVINLIAQREVAKVSPDVNGCTMQSTRYEIPFDGMNLVIFDTVGLEEPQMGVNGYLKAIEKAYELIAELSAAGGVHLLLFCMRGGRITATTRSNYRLFRECLCSTKVPIALVFTDLEREVKMEDWWTRNRKYIEHCGIKSDGHACVTAVKDDTTGENEMYLESEKRICELLKGCALQGEAFSLEPLSWFVKVGRGMKSFIGKARNPKRKDIAKRLRDHCKLDPETAKGIADMIENKPDVAPRGAPDVFSSDKQEVASQNKAGIPQDKSEVVLQHNLDATLQDKPNVGFPDRSDVSRNEPIPPNKPGIPLPSEACVVSQNTPIAILPKKPNDVPLNQGVLTLNRPGVFPPSQPVVFPPKHYSDLEAEPRMGLLKNSDSTEHKECEDNGDQPPGGWAWY